MTVAEFWRTIEGILARLSDLAHHITWSTIGTAIRETIPILEEEEPREERSWLVWVTQGDDRVCSLCLENEGEYEQDEPKPFMPAHVMCRCHWEIAV